MDNNNLNETPAQPAEEAKVEEVKAEEIKPAETVIDETVSQVTYNYNTDEAEAPAEAGPKGLSIASLILGILSVLCCWWPCFNFILGIVGLILAIVAKKKKCEGPSTFGLILSIVGLVAMLLGSIIYIVGLIIYYSQS